MTALLLAMVCISALQASGTLVTFVQGQDTSPVQSTQAASIQVLNNATQVTFQVQPLSNVIKAGTFAKFNAHVVGNSSGQVFLQARGLPPGSIAIFSPNVGSANPTLNSSLTILTSANTPSGSYIITAIAIVDGIEYTNPINLQILPATSSPSSANTTLNVSVGTALSMAVITDQSQYGPNSTVDIQGQVTDATGSAVEGAAISIQVDAPNGAQLFYTNSSQTNSAGMFQAHTSIPSSAPTGTYSVFASAIKAGYSSTTTGTTFVVGISETPSVIIKAVYAGDSTGNPTSTFTIGQTIWVWVVIENIGPAFQGVVWIQVRDPNGVPVQIQINIAQLNAGQTVTDGVGFALPAHAAIGVYTVTALVSDKLISQGGTFLASSETQFALIG